MLDLMEKGITVEQSISANRKVAKHGEITAMYNMLTGIPSETMEDLKETGKFILQVTEENPNCIVHPPNKLIPYPGGEAYEIAVKHGYVPPEKPEEWMGKFNNKSGAENKGIVGSVIEAPKIAARAFQDLFTSNTPPKSIQKEKPSEELLDAANTVLEHHETSIEGDLLDDLASELAIEKKAHPSNELFDKTKQESGRTVRKPKKKDNSKYLKPKSESTKKSGTSTKKAKDSHTATPPAVVKQDEEFDLDL